MNPALAAPAAALQSQVVRIPNLPQPAGNRFPGEQLPCPGLGPARRPARLAGTEAGATGRLGRGPVGASPAGGPRRTRRCAARARPAPGRHPGADGPDRSPTQAGHQRRGRRAAVSSPAPRPTRPPPSPRWPPGSSRTRRARRRPSMPARRRRSSHSRIAGVERSPRARCRAPGRGSRARGPASRFSTMLTSTVTRADDDRRPAVAERVEGRHGDLHRGVADQARRVEHQRGRRRRGVGRRERAALEEQRDDRLREHDQADGRRHVQHQHHAQAARHRAPHAGEIVAAACARDARAARPSRSTRRTGRSAGTSAGRRSSATRPRPCPGSVARIVFTSTLIWTAARPSVPGPIRTRTSRRPGCRASSSGR